ncbi:MAG: endonuclease/exonuclease/phosphatase family protein [Nitrospira sp.]|nr:endonuclease/exonuclease/phosphatase family protein [Nitrospira sp.]MDE0485599.1 endonuclease/exonuclease/phosphatase family protein [Nitrospira sp.]
MAVPNPDVLRVGTWNIRWFPHGSPPDRPDRSIPPTDLEWLTCTIVWMQTDILVVQESLTTTEARSAWDRILTTLDRRTGASWQWSVQPCGRLDSHHVGILWNANRVTLSAIQSLWRLNSKATSAQNPCKGGLRPGHYARVRSKRQPGADFHVIGLHLKSGPTVAAVEARHAALNRIDTAVARFLEEDRDVMILGDFNTMGAGDRHSRRSELKYLKRMVAKESPGFHDLAPEPRCSHYFRGRGNWLDHVLVARDMTEIRARSARVTGYCAVAGCRQIKGEYPLAYQRLSDHCPVIIEIDNRDLD